MITIRRTANLTILNAWLTGAYDTNSQRGYIEGFNTFREYRDDLKTCDQYDKNKIKEAIVNLIVQFGDDTFCYEHCFYKFKVPCEKNLKILTNLIYHIVKNRD